MILCSRKRDLIIRGGENVYPFEIEHRLAEHADVAEVAVLGVDNEELGVAVEVVVVPRPGASVDGDTLRRYCAEALAAFKVPSETEIRNDGLPRTPTGDVMKRVLDGSAESTFIEE